MFLTVAATASLGLAAEKPKLSPFDAARKLQRQGKEKEAFLAYLAIPGAEHAAVSLARPKPKDYLQVLQTQAENLPLFVSPEVC